ncbi:hypothetical protein BC831DRAFT_552629 [Entophlyctis helioformis]|nr:hypothetical protein BC831DRAFT_552629 [Entophlyctis helioformis]
MQEDTSPLASPVSAPTSPTDAVASMEPMEALEALAPMAGKLGLEQPLLPPSSRLTFNFDDLMLSSLAAAPLLAPTAEEDSDSGANGSAGDEHVLTPATAIPLSPGAASLGDGWLLDLDQALPAAAVTAIELTTTTTTTTTTTKTTTADDADDAVHHDVVDDESTGSGGAQMAADDGTPASPVEAADADTTFSDYEDAHDGEDGEDASTPTDAAAPAAAPADDKQLWFSSGESGDVHHESGTGDAADAAEEPANATFEQHGDAADADADDNGSDANDDNDDDSDDDDDESIDSPGLFPVQFIPPAKLHDILGSLDDERLDSDEEPHAQLVHFVEQTAAATAQDLDDLLDETAAAVESRRPLSAQFLYEHRPAHLDFVHTAPSSLSETPSGSRFLLDDFGLPDPAASFVSVSNAVSHRLSQVGLASAAAADFYSLSYSANPSAVADSEPMPLSMPLRRLSTDIASYPEPLDGSPDVVDLNQQFYQSQSAASGSIHGDYDEALAFTYAGEPAGLDGIAFDDLYPPSAANAISTFDDLYPAVLRDDGVDSEIDDMGGAGNDDDDDDNNEAQQDQAHGSEYEQYRQYQEIQAQYEILQQQFAAQFSSPVVVERGGVQFGQDFDGETVQVVEALQYGDVERHAEIETASVVELVEAVEIETVATTIEETVEVEQHVETIEKHVEIETITTTVDETVEVEQHVEIAEIETATATVEETVEVEQHVETIEQHVEIETTTTTVEETVEVEQHVEITEIETTTATVEETVEVEQHVETTEIETATTTVDETVEVEQHVEIAEIETATATVEETVEVEQHVETIEKHVEIETITTTVDETVEVEQHVEIAEIETATATVEETVEVEQHVETIEQHVEIETTTTTVEETVEVEQHVETTEIETATTTIEETVEVEQHVETIEKHVEIETTTTTVDETVEVEQHVEIAEIETATATVEETVEVEQHVETIEQHVEIETTTTTVEETVEVEQHVEITEIETTTATVEETVEVEQHVETTEIETATTTVDETVEVEQHVETIEQHVEIETTTTTVDETVEVEQHVEITEIETTTATVEETVEVEQHVETIEQHVEIETTTTTVEETVEVEQHVEITEIETTTATVEETVEVEQHVETIEQHVEIETTTTTVDETVEVEQHVEITEIETTTATVEETVEVEQHVETIEQHVEIETTTTTVEETVEVEQHVETIEQHVEIETTTTTVEETVEVEQHVEITEIETTTATVEETVEVEQHVETIEQHVEIETTTTTVDETVEVEQHVEITEIETTTATVEETVEVEQHVETIEQHVEIETTTTTVEETVEVEQHVETIEQHVEIETTTTTVEETVEVEQHVETIEQHVEIETTTTTVDETVEVEQHVETIEKHVEIETTTTTVDETVEVEQHVEITEIETTTATVEETVEVEQHVEIETATTTIDETIEFEQHVKITEQNVETIEKHVETTEIKTATIVAAVRAPSPIHDGVFDDWEVVEKQIHVQDYETDDEHVAAVQSPAQVLLPAAVWERIFLHVSKRDPASLRILPLCCKTFRDVCREPSLRACLLIHDHSPQLVIHHIYTTEPQMLTFELAEALLRQGALLPKFLIETAYRAHANKSVVLPAGTAEFFVAHGFRAYGDKLRIRGVDPVDIEAADPDEAAASHGWLDDPAELIVSLARQPPDMDRLAVVVNEHLYVPALNAKAQQDSFDLGVLWDSLANLANYDPTANDGILLRVLRDTEWSIDTVAYILALGFVITRAVAVPLLMDTRIMTPDFAGVRALLKEYFPHDKLVAMVEDALYELLCQNRRASIRIVDFLIAEFKVPESTIGRALLAHPYDIREMRLKRRYVLPMATTFGLVHGGMSDAVWPVLVARFGLDHVFVESCLIDLLVGGTVRVASNPNEVVTPPPGRQLSTSKQPNRMLFSWMLRQRPPALDEETEALSRDSLAALYDMGVPIRPATFAPVAYMIFATRKVSPRFLDYMTRIERGLLRMTSSKHLAMPGSFPHGSSDSYDQLFNVAEWMATFREFVLDDPAWLAIMPVETAASHAGTNSNHSVTMSAAGSVAGDDDAASSVASMASPSVRSSISVPFAAANSSAAAMSTAPNHRTSFSNLQAGQIGITRSTINASSSSIFSSKGLFQSLTETVRMMDPRDGQWKELRRFYYALKELVALAEHVQEAASTQDWVLSSSASSLAEPMLQMDDVVDMQSPAVQSEQLSQAETADLAPASSEPVFDGEDVDVDAVHRPDLAVTTIESATTAIRLTASTVTGPFHIWKKDVEKALAAAAAASAGPPHDDRMRSMSAGSPHLGRSSLHYDGLAGERPAGWTIAAMGAVSSTSSWVRSWFSHNK